MVGGPLALRKRPEIEQQRHTLGNIFRGVTPLEHPCDVLVDEWTDPGRANSIDGLRPYVIAFQHRQPPCAVGARRSSAPTSGPQDVTLRVRICKPGRN